MPHIILYQPEIPPNTGNIIRLCANVGFSLHLIKPLGFEIDDKRLRRAGLDYCEWKTMQVHDNFEACLAEIGDYHKVYLCETYGQQGYHQVNYQQNDVLVFGPETRGLPNEMLESWPQDQLIRLPMRPESRSMNLSNCVAVVVYQVWQSIGFDGAFEI